MEGIASAVGSLGVMISEKRERHNLRVEGPAAGHGDHSASMVRFALLAVS